MVPLDELRFGQLIVPDEFKDPHVTVFVPALILPHVTVFVPALIGPWQVILPHFNKFDPPSMVPLLVTPANVADTLLEIPEQVIAPQVIELAPAAIGPWQIKLPHFNEFNPPSMTPLIVTPANVEFAVLEIPVQLIAPQVIELLPAAMAAEVVNPAHVIP